jgi:hypothetical protein
MLKQKDDGNASIDEDSSKEDTADDPSKDGIQSKNNIKADNKYKEGPKKEGPKGDVRKSKRVRERIPKKMRRARFIWVTLGLAFYFSL